MNAIAFVACLFFAWLQSKHKLLMATEPLGRNSRPYRVLNAPLSKDKIISFLKNRRIPRSGYGDDNYQCSCSVDCVITDYTGCTNDTRILRFSRHSCSVPGHGASGDMILRLCSAFPAWKRRKTMNEVTVMRFVARHANRNILRVPDVLDFSVDGELELEGREYILSPLMKGTPIAVLWDSMSLERKVKYASNIARVIAEIRRISPEFHCGGCFGQVGTPSENDGTSLPLVSNFIDGGAPQAQDYTTFYKSSILYYLGFVEKDPQFEQVVVKLKEWLSCCLPKLTECSCPKFVLSHTDLSANNVFVESSSLEITAILDWEWSCAAPPNEDIVNELYFFEEDANAQIISEAFLQALESYGISRPSKSISLAQKVAGHMMAAACFRDWMVDLQEQENFATKTRAALFQLMDESFRILSQ